jgi:lysophospholipase L1-like esterase
MAALDGGPAEHLCPSAGEVIELRGDSHVAGSRMGVPAGTTGRAYPQVMQEQFAFPVKVIASGVGGFTAPMAEQHWRNSSAQGRIVMLAFGTNDAAPRGWLAAKQPVPVASFRASLTRQLARLRSQGARPALIAPPPAGSEAMNERIAPYRQAVAAVGKATGTPVFDPAEAIAGCADQQPLLVHDALHFNQAGHQCIGTWLARAICKA